LSITRTEATDDRLMNGGFPFAQCLFFKRRQRSPRHPNPQPTGFHEARIARHLFGIGEASDDHVVHRRESQGPLRRRRLDGELVEDQAGRADDGRPARRIKSGKAGAQGREGVDPVARVCSLTTVEPVRVAPGPAGPERRNANQTPNPRAAITAAPTNMPATLRPARRGSGMAASVQDWERAARFDVNTAIRGPAADGPPSISNRGRGGASSPFRWGHILIRNQIGTRSFTLKKSPVRSDATSIRRGRRAWYNKWRVAFAKSGADRPD
jgi:hypothetical protein